MPLLDDFQSSSGGQMLMCDLEVAIEYGTHLVLVVDGTFG
jgi:hypothetical protein